MNSAAAVSEPVASSRAGTWLHRHLDHLLAGVILVWGMTDAATSRFAHGPFVLNALVVAGLAGAALLRRRAPLTFTAVSLLLAIVSTIWLTDVAKVQWSLYLLIVPAYTVAAYTDLRPALLGLAMALVAPTIVDALQSDFLGNVSFTLPLSIASWSAGRAMRHRRQLTAELEDRAARLEAEREARERLAVADERTRIARELHALVANSVSAMVVQSEAAQRLLDDDPPAADAAMAAIEDTGREALGEMRRILGVLRRADDGAELTPQPGIGQIHALIERAREHGQPVELHVEGEPGPLPTTVDLAVYRILEEALAQSAPGAVRPSAATLGITLRFTDAAVVLALTVTGTAVAWPTIGMRERVALCEGTLSDEPTGSGRRLVAELPRAFEEVFA